MSENCEIWKNIVGYEGLYEISSHGSVRRVNIGIGNKFRPLKPVSNGKYLKVHLSKENKQKQVYIHELVARAFIGKKPSGMQHNHIDGNKANNSYMNLEYLTPAANTRHAFSMGLIDRSGEKNSNSKLTRKDVDLIRAKAKKGITQRSIAEEFCVKPNTISQIISGNRWRDHQRIPDVREL